MADDLEKYDENMPDLPIFDISGMNLVQLGRQLQDNLNSHRSGWLWLKKRQNEKMFLDEERLRALIAQIQDLRDMNSALLELNAEVYLTQERMARIVQRYREHENFVDAEGHRLSEIAEAKHINEMQKLEDEIHTRRKSIDALELDNERRKVEINVLKAQESNLKAQREKEDIRMGLMRKVVDKIDINELPDYLRTFVINSIFNPSQTITNEMQLMDDLREFALRRAAAETRQTEAEARKHESQADIERTTADKSMIDFNEYKKRGGN
ncbi:hypothetical protein LLG96_14220 [bacterium]|nr:hypothetical protein [bacterium]